MEIVFHHMAVSHPSNSARLMLEHKGLPHRTVLVPVGLQPIVLPTLGYRSITVPALKIDGRRVQGSRRISRELERLKPDPPLFPADPERRRAVEEAERWGEEELQPTPRNAFRWAAIEHPDVLEMFVALQGVPFPNVVAPIEGVVIRPWLRRVGGSSARVRADLAKLPERLDHADRLIDEGVIGGPERNAADFQIATSISSLMAIADLRPYVEERPVARLGAELWPDVGASMGPVFPPEWLPARAGAVA
jgi:glutathione S-transferase